MTSSQYGHTMKRNTLEPDIKDLPCTIPVFPLNGALLLPGGRLPLNIFEPRYLAMVSNALSTPYRLIGMIQSNAAKNLDHASPALYQTGCVGRIASFEETTDGRYLISLDGIIRFTVIAEMEEKSGYRRCEVSYDNFKADMEIADLAFDRQYLHDVLKTYLVAKGFSADWDMIKQYDDEKLITALAMICPLGTEEKQMLLEAETPTKRGETLTTLLEINMRDTHHGFQKQARH